MKGLKLMKKLFTAVFMVSVFIVPSYAQDNTQAEPQEYASMQEVSATGHQNVAEKGLTEECSGICFGADMAFLNKYVSRGMTTNNDPVFEPNPWVSYKGFTASAWGNMDLTNYNGMSGNLNEMDYTLDYSNNLDKLSYSAGLVYYTFPHTGAKDTSEAYIGVGYSILLKPKLVVYYDFLQVDGFYGNFAISHSFDVPEFSKVVKTSLDLCAQVGMGSKNFNSFNFGCDHTAFTDMVFTASLPVVVSDHFSIKPTVSYSTVLDRTIRTKNFKNDNVIWGVVASANF